MRYLTSAPPSEKSLSGENATPYRRLVSRTIGVKHPVALFLIVLLAGAVRLYGLDFHSLNGDEYNSIAEAMDVGLNWNGILYHTLMNAWIQFGQSDFWLRVPAALFGVFTVVLLYWAGNLLLGNPAGTLAALLAALNPFSVYHSQEVRFYSFFLFTSALFLLVTVALVEGSERWKQKSVILATGAVLLLVGSHYFGLLAVVVQIAVIFVARRSRWPRRRRAIIVVCGLVLLFLLPLLPVTQDILLTIYAQTGNVTSIPQQLFSPISIVNAVKAAIAFYVFGFGYQVYPGTIIVVIPGILILGSLLVAGSIRLSPTRWMALPIIYFLGLFAVYFPLDAAGGVLAGGIAPRHASFVWPAFILLLAIGLTSLGPFLRYTLLLGLVVLNVYALLPRWQTGTWAYGTALSDFRGAAILADEWATDNTAILRGGRAARPVDRYYPSSIPSLAFYSYVAGADFSTLQSYDRLILVTNDFRSDSRTQYNNVFSRIESAYSWSEGSVQYPMFQYLFERKPSDMPGYRPDAVTGQIHHPLRLYGLEFQDLQLPVQIESNGVSFHIVGSFFLPDLSGERGQSIPLDSAVDGSELIILSNVVNVRDIENGAQVGEVTIITKDGQSWTAPMRLGEETERWDKECAPVASCDTVYRWHKRIALVGQRAYPDAWRDFQASIHAATIALPEPAEIEHISFQYSHDAGQLYIWGIAIPRRNE